MATLQTTTITGFLNLCQASSTTSVKCRLWYDNTTNSLNYVIADFSPGTWSTTGNMNVGRFNMHGTGTVNAGLTAGGRDGVPNIFRNTEEYNGNSWSNGGLLITCGYGVAMSGTQNSGLGINGAPSTNCTQEYNGNSWATGGATNVTTINRGATGTQNASLALGSPFPVTSQTEEYNGSTWSTGPNMNELCTKGIAAGTVNSALYAGGNACCTELYDGVAWTVASAGLSFPFPSPSGFGTGQTNALIASDNSLRQKVEAYNGVAWASQGDLNLRRRFFGAGAGSRSEGFVAGGCGDPGSTVTTEEFSSAATTSVRCLC